MQADEVGVEVGEHGDAAEHGLKHNAEAGNEREHKQVTPPAFDEQDAGEGGDQSTEKIAQSLLFHVGQDSVLSFFDKPEACPR